MAGNEEQIEYWNGEAGSTWVRAQERLDETLSALSHAAVEHAAVQPGERIVDVGCGCGATTLTLAGRGASVWGVDISEPMLARARERAAGMDDPSAAFANLRTALHRNGRLVFLCWQAPKFNPWISVAGRAVQAFLPEPAEAPDPRAPGPFAFADPGYLQEILAAAGYSGVSCDPVEATMRLGGSLDEAMEFQSQVGPLSRVLKELEGDVRAGALAAARDALGAYDTGGGIELGAACWLVSARA
jgi:SAM-dependent methyltransferase